MGSTQPTPPPGAASPPSVAATGSQAEILFAQGSFTEAAAEYAKALAADPDSAAALARLTSNDLRLHA
jgi:hypothetical protein